MVVLPPSFCICGDENRFPSAQKTICGSGRLSMIPPHPKQGFEIGRNSAFLLTLLVLLLSAFLGQGTVPALADTTQCLYGSKAYATYMENAKGVPIDFCIYQENNDIIFKISCSPGQCSNWHWPDGDGSITDGTRPWFFINGSYTYEIRDSVTHIIVGGVNHIGNDAFNGFSNLKSVEIADDVESIGQAVFANCSNLENLIIPPSVEKIGPYAFSGVKGPVYAPAASLPEDPGEVTSSLVEYSALTLNPHKAGIITNVDQVKQQSENELPGGITKNNTSDTYYLRAKKPVGLKVDPGSDFVKVSAVSDNTHLSLTRSGTEFSLTMPAESVTFSTAAVSLSVDPLTYNGEEQTAVTVKDGNTTLTAGTDYDVTFLQNGTGITPKNAGEYTAVITGKGSYIGTASVSFTVNKADIKPTVTMSDYTYGGTVPAPGIAEGGNPGSGAVTYYYSTVNSTGNGIKWENITGTTLEAGTYYMYAVVAETDNYKEGTTAAVSFIVKAADGAVVTITGHYDKADYDGQEHSVSGYDVDISDPLYDESYFTFAGTAEAKRIGVGTTVMGLKAEQFTNTNKNFTNVLFTVTDGYQTVAPIPVTIKAENKTKQYDNDESTDPALTAEISGKPEKGVDPVYTLSREPGQDVGNYLITVTAEEASNPNYKITVKNGTFSITKKSEPGPEPEPDPPSRRIDFFRIFEETQLPATGFSSQLTNTLSEQPMALNYEPVHLSLQIPTLNLETELVTVPLMDATWQVAWLGNHAGLLEGSALPGEGYSFIAAHNTLNSEDYGPFALLSTMEPNDLIIVNSEEDTIKLFRVYANELIDENDVQKLTKVAQQEADSLVLITCENESVEGGYLNRRVIFAKPL